MAVTPDCAEGRHAPVCRGSGPNYYCPQSEALEQRCACRCHDDDDSRTPPRKEKSNG